MDLLGRKLQLPRAEQMIRLGLTFRHFFLANRTDNGLCVVSDLIYFKPRQNTEFLDFVCLVIPRALHRSVKYHIHGIPSSRDITSVICTK